MRNIIIVNMVSTGANFIGDIIRRNYNPIVLEMVPDDSEELIEEYQSAISSAYDSIKESFEIIHEKDSYHQTLEMIKKLDPILVLPGSELGVELASKLSNDLDLYSNPIESLPAMTQKDEMQNALKKAGIRSIKGKVIYSVEEALDYYEKSGLKEVVVKPIRGSGSVGVAICTNKEELREAIKNTFIETNTRNWCASSLKDIKTKNTQDENIDDESVAIVVQERINGPEYIVNTVSSNGKHRITAIWSYKKIKTTENHYIYQHMEAIDELDISQAEMIEYAYQVADAIGVKYGAIHGEYMIDEKGPVLIEVNCRPCGGSMVTDFLDKIFGQHETDSILDAYLNPKRFNKKRQERYRLLSQGALKFFIVPQDIEAKSMPIETIASKLESHYKTNVPNIEDRQFFPKTDDLHTNGGVIYLTNKDKSAIQNDVNYLNTIESYAFSQVISSGLDKKQEKEENTANVRELLKNQIDGELGDVLLITDNPIEDDRIYNCSINEIDEAPDNFDVVIIDLDDSIVGKLDSDISQLILSLLAKINVGGLVFIPENTYQYIGGGRNGAEALVKLMNLRIEVPPQGIKNTIIASKN